MKSHRGRPNPQTATSTISPPPILKGTRLCCQISAKSTVTELRGFVFYGPLCRRWVTPKWRLPYRAPNRAEGVQLLYSPGSNI